MRTRWPSSFSIPLVSILRSKGSPLSMSNLMVSKVISRIPPPERRGATPCDPFSPATSFGLSEVGAACDPLGGLPFSLALAPLVDGSTLSTVALAVRISPVLAPDVPARVREASPQPVLKKRNRGTIPPTEMHAMMVRARFIESPHHRAGIRHPRRRPQPGRV